MIEWYDNKSLDNHLEKHIIKSTSEQEIWINNFDKIKEYLNNKEINYLKDEYEKISINNTKDTDHYLYKDAVSQNFSINFYKDYNNKYLTTCTKYKFRKLKISSCFFKDTSHTNLKIFLSINNLKFDDINNKTMIITNFKSFSPNYNEIDKIYKNAIIYTNLQDPSKSDEELLLKFRVCIILESLKVLIKKQDYLYYSKNTMTKNIYLYDVLFKIFNNIYNKLIEKDKTLEFTEEEIKQMYNLNLYIKDIMKDSNLYLEDKVYVDLLAEFNNLFNYYSNGRYFINIENSVWDNMFNSFK